ncbi:MAG TPA: hypothetical protein VFS08_02365 [Gemmatimonadaceae bacterium]|nr:hypothetical protein [Gemmatimonadaceae bacterium]
MIPHARRVPVAPPARAALPAALPAALLAILLAGAACRGPRAADAAGEVASSVAGGAVDSTFGATIARLSEPGGYFDSDNLVSNETSVLHVLGALERRGTRGGAYVGVGPEQNFSYIAAVRPRVAYVIDIRRDNLLQQLWYKALFELAPDRASFLLLLTGRPLPPDVARWRDSTLEAVIALVDRTPPDSAAAARARARVGETVLGFGVPLDTADRATIARIHDAFIEAGLDLRFTSFGRRPRAYYPTLRQLLLAEDRDGNRLGFLASPERYGVVRRLELEDRVIPVVGDLAGSHALAAIGRDIARRGLVLSAFYTSNVEFYLWGDGTFERFARTVATLPRDRHSVIIRSCFGFACGPAHPDAVPGHYSVQSAQAVDDFVAAQRGGELGSYTDVVRARLLPH